VKHQVENSKTAYVAVATHVTILELNKHFTVDEINSQDLDGLGLVNDDVVHDVLNQ
jgi:hypothetical protein